jgi:hypothetical protein
MASVIVSRLTIFLLLGVSADLLHGFGRFNLQNTSRRGGPKCRGSADHLGRLEEKGWRNGQA